MKFDVRFYLIAILFIIFDLAFVLFPGRWSSKQIGIVSLDRNGAVPRLTIGFVYVWKKGLEMGMTTGLPSAGHFDNPVPIGRVDDDTCVPGGGNPCLADTRLRRPVDAPSSTGRGPARCG